MGQRALGLRRKGFTLVELAVVIVITGLLIGGILVGRSIMAQARNVSLVRQMEQIDIALSNFKLAYRGLPGDVPAFGGDGDGIPEDGLSPDGEAQYFQGEAANFWSQLKIAGFAPDDAYTPVITGHFNAPPASRNGPVMAYDRTSSAVIYSNPINRNFYRIGNYANLTDNSIKFSNLPGQSSINGYDVLAIDSKIDDGVITSAVPKNMFGVAYLYPLPPQLCTVNYNCVVFIRMLSQAGQSK